MELEDQGRRRWRIDTTINLQGLLSGAAGAAAAIILAWFALAGDIRDLRNKDVSHDASITRLETDMQRQRQETKDQLRDLSADVKEKLNDVSSDVKDIRKVLFDNAAGARPDMRRWSR